MRTEGNNTWKVSVDVSVTTVVVIPGFSNLALNPAAWKSCETSPGAWEDLARGGGLCATPSALLLENGEGQGMPSAH